MDPSSGGPAQGIRNNILFWRKYGLEPNVLSLDDAKAEFVIKDNIIGLGATNNKWAYSAALMPWLLDNLSKYDVVLIHGLWLYHSYAVMKVIKILKKKSKVSSVHIPKVYVMPHGMLDPYFQKAKDRQLKALRNIIYWYLIEKHVINNANGILFTCEEEMKLAATTFSNYKPKATENIGYGIVSPPPFSSNQASAFSKLCPALNGRPYFLFLSRIHIKKGIDILIEAYKYCYMYFKKFKVEIPALVIVGPGLDTDYGKQIFGMVNTDEMLHRSVYFTGMLQGNEKWGAIYGCELFVLPSHQENFGIAIVEAMACSKPVIITNKVNIWREIHNDNAGIVVNDDLASMIKALILWQEKSEAAKLTMATNAFSSYKVNFTAEATSKKFVSILNAK